MTEQTPLISVIVPCYNYGRFVGETLDSVLAQTYPHWECIVVDDGSTDNSAAVVGAYVAKYGGQIRYVYQPNQGLPAARNTGIAHAQGVYIQLLDADDLLLPKRFEGMVATFCKQPDADIVYSDMRYFLDGDTQKWFYSTGQFDRAWTLRRTGNGIALLHRLVYSCVILPPMPLLHRRVIERVGMFSRHLRSCEDWEYWIRCAAANLNFVYDDSTDILCLMRVHTSSMTRNRVVMLDSMVQVRTEIRPLLEQTAPQCVSINERCLDNDYIEQGIVYEQWKSRQAGKALVQQYADTRRSLKLHLFAWLGRVLSMQTRLQLLALVRSFGKKTLD